MPHRHASSLPVRRRESYHHARHQAATTAHAASPMCVVGYAFCTPCDVYLYDGEKEVGRKGNLQLYLVNRQLGGRQGGRGTSVTYLHYSSWNCWVVVNSLFFYSLHCCLPSLLVLGGNPALDVPNLPLPAWFNWGVEEQPQTCACAHPDLTVTCTAPATTTITTAGNDITTATLYSCGTTWYSEK